MRKTGKTYKIDFGYGVYEADNFIDAKFINVTLSESLIKESAEYIEKNHGGNVKSVEIEDLIRLTEKVVDEIYCNDINDMLPETTDWDNIRVVLAEPMPTALTDALEEYIQNREIHLDYSVQDGDMVEKNCVCTYVSKKSFLKMVESLPLLQNGVKDFNLLKEFSREAFNEALQKAKENAAKCGFLKDGSVVLLGMYPYEVYESA